MIQNLSKDITGILSDEGDSKHYKYNGMDLTDAYAKLIVLAGIIIYTFIFAIKYLKREFTIIFLILLGPVSCITYPIDKISDGKAQAFNKWFSEFLYQVIIQPFHLLLYIVLIGSATELANANVIYAIVCFAVMIPAEKFIKEMFGFRDKLGSPLGAFAGGALASKALSAVMGKGKGSSGSGGKEGENDNSSVPNELPPRTVDKPGLVGGNAPSSDAGENDNSPHRIDNPEEGEDTQPLDMGEDTEGGEDTQPLDMGEDREEGEDDRLPLDTAEDSEERENDNSPQRIDNPEEGENQQSKWERFKSVHNQRVSKKYGSTNRKQRWKRRIAKGAKAGAKGLLKGGAIGLVGTAAMAGALMTGNGKEALGIAAGIGAYAGKKAISGGKKAIKGAKGAVKDYYNKSAIPFLNPDQEKQAFKAFQADSKQMDKAVLSYRKNHDGEPTYEDLENEMNDRFALSRYGLSDDQIDNAVGSFQKLRDSGIDENDALNQTAYAAKLADDYSKKDFRSEKTMKEAVNTIADNFEKYGVGRDIAERNAEKYLRQAAGIKGVEIALPSTNQTIDVSIPNGETMAVALGVGNSSDFNEVQMKRVNKLTLRMHDAGYSNEEIKMVAKSTADSDKVSTSVIDKFELKVNYLTDKNAQKQTREFLETGNKEKVTDKDVKTEHIERAELYAISGFDAKNMNEHRIVEENLFKSKSDKERSRKLADMTSKTQMMNETDADKMIETEIKRLTADGKVSESTARKRAINIVNQAASLKGIDGGIKSKYNKK